jgi:hypothetical protein
MQGELLLPLLLLPLLLLPLLLLPPPLPSATAISTSTTIAPAAFQLTLLFRAYQHILSKGKAAHISHAPFIPLPELLVLAMPRMVASRYCSTQP